MRPWPSAPRSRRRAVRRGEGRAAARRHAAVARHRDAGRRDDQADREEHHDPDQGESQVFSTADDNQTAVTIHVLQGERERARQQVARPFDLTDIPPAPRGMPQIEVTFDIDANGILNVSAKDKATGKEQKIVIKASSGLSEDEIKRMVRMPRRMPRTDEIPRAGRDAQPADALVHATEKSLKELGDKVSPAGPRQGRVRAVRPQGRDQGRRQGQDRARSRGAGRGLAAIAQAGLRAGRRRRRCGDDGRRPGAGSAARTTMSSMPSSRK
jgi:hypothetical protein